MGTTYSRSLIFLSIFGFLHTALLVLYFMVFLFLGLISVLLLLLYLEQATRSWRRGVSTAVSGQSTAKNRT
jgi:hypothetical protein